MPNIEVYGFEKLQWRELEGKIWDLIMRRAPMVKKDVVITFVTSWVRDEKRQERPFVRVASTDKTDRVRIARPINKELNLDVEWLHLDGFFEGKG